MPIVALPYAHTTSYYVIHLQAAAINQDVNFYDLVCQPRRLTAVSVVVTVVCASLLGSMNVFTKFHGVPFNSCLRYFSLDQSDRLTFPSLELFHIAKSKFHVPNEK